MKKYFVTAIDSLNIPTACNTFDTRKECLDWFFANHDNGGCSYRIKMSKTIRNSRSLPTMFEDREFARLCSEDD